jgi:CIC family chloride channel protein
LGRNRKFFEFAEDLLLPIMLGLVIGLAVFLLDNVYRAVNYASLLLVGWNPLLLLASTFIALLGGYLIVRLLAENKKCGCGAELVIESYHSRSGFLGLRDTMSKTIASAVTIGFGGSAGLEGPSLLLGGGISSFITRKLGLSRKDVKKLFLCGAAAGFSAIFRAPLTGILLALEIPYKRDVETEVFVPASIASVTAYLVSAMTFGMETIFPSPTSPTPILSIHASILAHAVALGVLAALVALTFVKALEGVNAIVGRLARSLPMPCIAILGGLLLGVIGLFYPKTLGLGYDTIREMTTTRLGETSSMMLIALLVFKIIATSVTLNFGGSGGLFIPALYVGGTLGLIYAQALKVEPPASCVVLAMAAVLAAANKTLLTSIALVAETIGPSFIVPTVVSAAVSYFLTGSASFYKSQLLSKNEGGVAS